MSQRRCHLAIEQGRNSLHRTLMQGGLLKRQWEHGDAMISLWWGPIAKVRNGDTLVYFVGLDGIAIEAVLRPAQLSVEVPQPIDL